MRHEDGHFAAAHGEDVYYQDWRPDGETRAVMLLVHGLAEHSSRYAGFADFFTSNGIAVYTLDHPGHGKSGGRRAHVRHFDDFHDALAQRLTMAKTENPGLPVFLLGHSLGGLIAASFLLERQADFAGAVFSGAAIRAPQEPSGFALLINRVISIVWPTLGVLQLDANGVSRDAAVVEAYESDPLVFRGKVTARLAAEVFRVMDVVRNNASRIALPILVLHGEADVMTDPAGSLELHENAASADKNIIVYDGLYHEIFNEPERLKVMGDVLDWLDAQLSGG